MPCSSESFCRERSGGRWSERIRLSECFPVPVITYPWTLKDLAVSSTSTKYMFAFIHALGFVSVPVLRAVPIL